MRWTKEQERAIYENGATLMVSAAAGSGKTAVLVARLLRRVLDADEPVDVDRFLVVTFTESAASEMRERIAETLEEHLERAQSQKEAAMLRRQATLVARAPISTLHGFCWRLLKQNFHLLGLDPSLRALDPREAVLLRQEVLEQVLDEAYESADPAFFDLLDRYGGRDGDLGLQDRLLKVYDYIRSLPSPHAWLEKAEHMLSAPYERVEDTPWFPILREAAMLDLDRAHDQLLQMAACCNLPGGPGAYEATATDKAAAVVASREALSAAGWDELQSGLESLVSILSKRLPGARQQDIDPDLKKLAQELHNKAKKTVQSVADRFSGKGSSRLDELAHVSGAIHVFCNLVRRFDACYARAKEQRNAIDFNDMEQYALRLLSEEGDLNRPSELASTLRQNLVEILVDESQDLNEAQHAILDLLARELPNGGRNLFLVGDVKQSIYRFRNAEPELFLARYQEASDDQNAAERRMALSHNFRCRRTVVAAVNQLFRRIMIASMGRLDYDAEAELVYSANYPPLDGAAALESDPPVELLLLEKPDQSAASSDQSDSSSDEEAHEADPGGQLPLEWLELRSTEHEAVAAAQRIKGLFAEGTRVWDRHAGTYRPLRYSDITILLRSPYGRAEYFQEVLGRFGIPAVSPRAGKLSGDLEAETVLSLLRLLDNPRQDIPLATVLLSPIVGLDPAALADIRLHDKKGDLWDAVQAISGQDARAKSPSLVSLKKFLHRFERWRGWARSMPVAALLARIYAETGYVDSLLYEPDGVQRREQLYALYDQARAFDRFGRSGIFSFLRFVERLREQNEDLAAAVPEAAQEGDAVLIQSIHASKGLEYPVVILAGLGFAFNRTDQTDDLLLHRSLGFGPALVDWQGGWKESSLAHMAIQELLSTELLAEELRVLYVGMTRARERLILIGTMSKSWDLVELESSSADPSTPLGLAQLRNANRYLDWILPVLASSGIKAVIQKQLGPRVDDAAAEWHVQMVDSTDQAQFFMHAKAGTDQATPNAERSTETLVERTAEQDTVRFVEHAVSLEEGMDELTLSETAATAAAMSVPYLHLPATLMPAKYTVSELKRRFDPWVDDESPGSSPRPKKKSWTRRPQLDRKTAPTPAERGTWTHRLLQHVDLRGALDLEGLTRQVELLVEQELFLPEQAEAINVKQLAALFASPIGRRISRDPSTVQRELPFALPISASWLIDGSQSLSALDSPSAALVAAAREEADDHPVDQEFVLVQGVIDCLVQEDNHLLLVDFKTDRLWGRSVVDAAEEYRIPMQMYGLAARKMFSPHSLELCLYFLETGEFTIIPELTM